MRWGWGPTDPRDSRGAETIRAAGLPLVTIATKADFG
jgi:hypothetical protein